MVDGTGSGGFQRHQGGKVKPAKIGFDGGEAGFFQHNLIFFDREGDEDVFQGLAFFGDFQLRIATGLLELVVIGDELTIEARVMTDDLFTDKENTAGPKGIEESG